jgi:hypothetical protein
VSDSKGHYIGTIHGGMWEIFPYSPHMIKEIRRVNRECPGEIKLLGIFPSKAQAEEICGRHVSPEQHVKRSEEVAGLLEQLAELRRAEEEATQ